jgi:hypothetical protein
MTNPKNTRITRATVTVAKPVAAHKTKSSVPAAGVQVNPSSKAPAKTALKSAAKSASAAVLGLGQAEAQACA